VAMTKGESRPAHDEMTIRRARLWSGALVRAKPVALGLILGGTHRGARYLASHSRSFTRTDPITSCALMGRVRAQPVASSLLLWSHAPAPVRTSQHGLGDPPSNERTLTRSFREWRNGSRHRLYPGSLTTSSGSRSAEDRRNRPPPASGNTAHLGCC
jgi:hypothetical protein